MPTSSPEHRARPDRRRQSRGGRREGDQFEFAPLVLLVGDDGPVTSMAEAVLARLRFAVTTSKTVDEALKVVSGLRPEVLVASPEAAARVRADVADPLSIVEMTDEMRGNPEAIVPAIRRTLGARAH